MALVVFESRVNMLTVATPSIGGYVIAYDSADGILKQKNDQGVISAIAGSSPVGSLTQTLAIGNNTGTFSINLGANTKIGSTMGGGQLRLDNGVGGINIVNLSTDYGALAQSYLYMSSNSLTLKSLNASLSFSSSAATFQLNSSNASSFSLNNYYITLNANKVLTFTTATASTGIIDKISALISTKNSKLGSGVYNTVVLGGNGITGATSNSVYVPNVYVQDGGFVKGTDGSGKLTFNSDEEVYLTSNTYASNTGIGILYSGTTTLSNYNGIFITDGEYAITTGPMLLNTLISTANTTIMDGVSNTVIIGGDGLYATHSNTTYIGGTVDINNQYKLPTSDGISGQVIQTDGAGSTYWGTATGMVTEITTASFSSLFLETGGIFDANTTYKILDANIDLYGGTEIYLTTNASGILNETGVGKFYTPLYDQGTPGFGIYATSSTYTSGDTAIWGGKFWIRNSTSFISFPYPIDAFTLNTSYWIEVNFDDPYSSAYYKITYDEIKYDIINDSIIYRNEKNTNIVSTNKMNIDLLGVNLYSNHPIKGFQWGNVYDTMTGFGIGQQYIENSYNENINFTGSFQTNIRFYDISKQSNCLFSNDSSQDNIVLENSIQEDCTFYNSTQNKMRLSNSNQRWSNFVNSQQEYITIENASSQVYLTFRDSLQSHITITNESYQSNLMMFTGSQIQINLDGNSWQDDIELANLSRQIYLNFDDNSSQQSISLDNGSEQSHLNFNDNSLQLSLTEKTGLIQHSLRFFNYSWDRNGQSMTSNEEDLFLNGDKLIYQVPTGQVSKGIGEVVLFGTSSTTLIPGLIYQFGKDGRWLKASFTGGLTASGLLGIALGEYVSDGFLTKGYATFDLEHYGIMDIGSTMYLNIDGTFDNTPTTTSGQVVRIVGYCIGDPDGYTSTLGVLYFCPDTTWIEIA